jgi:uncharacterized protein YjbI with pentapeptide repeats
MHNMTTPSRTAEPQRWQEITAIWRDNRWLYVVVGVLLGLLITPAIEQITGNLNNLISNLVPEAIGIVFTVLILNRLADNRAKEELKHRLMQEVRSPSAGTAVTALNWLRRENLITSNLFKKQVLGNINWEGAYIGDLNLQGSILWRASFKNVTNTLLSFDGNGEERSLNLSHADLREANLAYALIPHANLEQANLYRANLQQANLPSANLQYADLQQANLQHTYLEQANLQYADLGEANLQYADLPSANLAHANLPSAKLQYANLRESNLSHAYLQDANLQYVRLTFANLQHAHLEQANLQEAALGSVNLNAANMQAACLQETNLRFANLQDAYLEHANLQATNLEQTNLREANLEEAIFNEKTILPDAQRLIDEEGYWLRDDEGNFVYTEASYWSADTDMTHYTDPNHPNFWVPDYLEPNYKGAIPPWLEKQREAEGSGS